MLPPSLCIDLGSAYTKIGFRETPCSQARLLSLEELNLDEQHVCVPSVAAWRERDDRWVFGIDAADLVEGNGILVFRNWKADLFPDGERAVNPWDLLGEDPHEGLRDGPGSYARARNVASRYLTWLRQDLVPRMLPGVDLSKVVLRLCIPEFAMFSPHAAEMDRMLEAAGWHNPASFCSSEPMSNLTGALTQGHNAVLEPQPGKVFADIPKMFARSHLLEMVAACQEGDEGDVSEYATLIIDVGAYTTDFGLISIDLAGHGFFPISETHSVPLGVHELDRRVVDVLPEPLGSAVSRFSGREWERFHRVVYTEDREWGLPTGGVVNGSEEERTRIANVVVQFAAEIAAGLNDFLEQYRPPAVQEVILTGGGNNIPELARRLRTALARWGVATFYLPKAGLSLNGARQVEIVPSVVRGASAVGGASVLFDLA
jgi:hypothetical protein